MYSPLDSLSFRDAVCVVVASLSRYIVFVSPLSRFLSVVVHAIRTFDMRYRWSLGSGPTCRPPIVAILDSG